MPETKLAFPEDLRLAARCAEGDGEAWRELVDRLGPRVRAIARRLLRRDLADDGAAEVFAHWLARGARVLRQYRGEAELEAYLAVVAERFLRGRSRVLAGRGVTLSLGALEAVRGEAPEAGDPARSEALQKALAELSERDRRLLELLYVDGLTHRQAASRMGIPLGSVATWAARARASLAAKIGEI